MKFLQTADWHLGKRLHDFSLLAVQREAIDSILTHVATERPDAVIVAGDIFDTQIPSLGALDLWEHAVDSIVGDLGVPMIVIPGNHDHPDRLSVHAGLARRTGLHFLRSLPGNVEPVVISGVHVYGVPFHKPVHVNAAFRDAAPGIGDFDYAAAMRHVLDQVRAAHAQRSGPAVLVAHAFVDGAGDEPEGEDAIQVGGAGGIPTSAFAGFSYVALGHIHGRRKLGAGEIHYSGSPFPYSFAEAGQQKSVHVVELDEDGRVTRLDHLPVHTSRGVQVIAGLSFAEVLAAAEAQPTDERQHYTLVRVNDTDPIDSARLREWYPNAVLEQPEIVARSRAPKLVGDYRTIQPEDAFRQFYRHVFGEDLPELEEALLLEALHAEDLPADEHAEGPA